LLINNTFASGSCAGGGNWADIVNADHFKRVELDNRVVHVGLLEFRDPLAGVKLPNPALNIHGSRWPEEFPEGVVGCNIMGKMAVIVMDPTEHAAATTLDLEMRRESDRESEFNEG
jgi:hypothetical protein